MVISQGNSCNQHMNAESHEDRLSSLPDELIHKILSFISIREAIGLSVLSSGWRIIWTSMSSLNFSSENFSSDFVSNVLSHRNYQTQVCSLKLAPGERVSDEFCKEVINYAFDHNIQQLTVTCFLKNNVKFPLSFYRCRSLKHLLLSGNSYFPSSFFVTPTWELPALTTLHLYDIKLFDDGEHADNKCIGLFSNCINLKNLFINRCRMIGANVFNIYHPRLSDLRIEDPLESWQVVNVVAPQLKNLTIKDYYGKFLISAPGLNSLVIKGYHPAHISTQGFCSVEKLDLLIFYPCLEDAGIIVNLLQQLQSLKFLTLNWEILEVSSLIMGLISHQPSLFASVKILKLIMSYPTRVYLEVQAHEKTTTPTEAKNCVLSTSPSDIFTMVSCEEIRVMQDIALVARMMGKLRVNHNKAIMEPANIAPRKNRKAKVKKLRLSTFKMHWHWEEMMEEIKQGNIEGLLTEWHFGEMMAEVTQGKIKGLPTNLPTEETCAMIPLLQHIKQLVAELPALKRAVMQATFLNLCEDAAILISIMFDGVQLRSRDLLRDCLISMEATKFKLTFCCC